MQSRPRPDVCTTKLVWPRRALARRLRSMGALTMDRGVERIEDVAARGSDVVTMWHDVAEVIAPLVPNRMGPCCFTLDPASLLMTSHFNPSMYYELPEEMLRDEYLL